jgi:hypothetical protein
MQIYTPMMQYRLGLLQKETKKKLKGKPFQILGLDVLIDDKMKAWVLEINHNPSLDIYFDTAFMQHNKNRTDADICPVDLHVKSRVVKDTIILASKKDLSEVDAYGTFKQIYPPMNRDNSLSMTTLELQKLFYGATKIRDKQKMSGQQFEKLADRAFLKKL